MVINMVLVVEDDPYLREELINTFIKKGYPASGISSFAAPEKEIMEMSPELVILDVNLPGKSGFELCRILKAKASFPILILTARDTLPDELHALGLGADDFLTKPCHPDRLLARAERLTRMYGKVKNHMHAGNLEYDPDTNKVMWGESFAVLSETEGKIMRALIEGYPLVIPKDVLSNILWGGYADENILAVNMTRLRKTLDSIGLGSKIITERGVGYRLGI